MKLLWIFGHSSDLVPKCSTVLRDKDRTMKAKTRHRKSYKWRKRADSSPVAKGRRRKIRGKRNPRKTKHLGAKGL